MSKIEVILKIYNTTGRPANDVRPEDWPVFTGSYIDCRSLAYKLDQVRWNYTCKFFVDGKEVSEIQAFNYLKYGAQIKAKFSG